MVIKVPKEWWGKPPKQSLPKRKMQMNPQKKNILCSKKQKHPRGVDPSAIRADRVGTFLPISVAKAQKNKNPKNLRVDLFAVGLCKFVFARSDEKRSIGDFPRIISNLFFSAGFEDGLNQNKQQTTLECVTSASLPSFFPKSWSSLALSLSLVCSLGRIPNWTPAGGSDAECEDPKSF